MLSPHVTDSGQPEISNWNNCWTVISKRECGLTLTIEPAAAHWNPWGASCERTLWHRKKSKRLSATHSGRRRHNVKLESPVMVMHATTYTGPTPPHSHQSYRSKWQGLSKGTLGNIKCTLCSIKYTLSNIKDTLGLVQVVSSVVQVVSTILHIISRVVLTVSGIL